MHMPEDRKGAAKRANYMRWGKASCRCAITNLSVVLPRSESVMFDKDIVRWMTLFRCKDDDLCGTKQHTIQYFYIQCVACWCMVWRRTCDQDVADSTPDVWLSRNNPGQVVHTCVSVTKQYNLVPAKRWRCSGAGKVTASLASHWPCVTDTVLRDWGQVSTLSTLLC